MTAITEFLFPTPAERSLGGIVRWWEGRRLHYNVIVGASGVFSLGLMRLVSWLPPDPRPDFLPFGAVVVFGVAANICYGLGPVAEVVAEKLWGRRLLPIGPALYRMGLTFSVGLTLLPLLFVGADWLFRILRALI